MDRRLPLYDRLMLIVCVREQRLYAVKHGRIVREYPVSTSKFGTGNKQGSNKTPLGWHRIRNKIGQRARPGDIFINRRRTGKTISDLKNRRDLITSRILVLEGMESGFNKGKGIDSYEREIYIHGTAEELLIGKPVSHGCIRMKNLDIIALFELVRINTAVLIIL